MGDFFYAFSSTTIIMASWFRHWIGGNLNITGQLGKNALHHGQISAKRAELVDLALVSGKIYDGRGFKFIKECFDEGTLHLIVLFSNGDFHSQLEQWQFLLKRCM